MNLETGSLLSKEICLFTCHEVVKVPIVMNGLHEEICGVQAGYSAFAVQSQTGFDQVCALKFQISLN